MGFGPKMLMKHGWKPGEGIGAKNEGRAEPVEVEFRDPRKRGGLGKHDGNKKKKTGGVLFYCYFQY